MNKYECEELNATINDTSILREGCYLSSFLIQPHIFHFTVPSAPEQLQKHMHQTFEISIVLEGKITYCIDRLEFTLLAGDMVIIPPRQEHCWRLHGINTIIVSSMCFISGRGTHPRRQITKLMTALENRQYHIKQFSVYENCVRNILDLLHNPLVFYEEEIRKQQELSYIYVFRTLLPKWLDIERPTKRSGNNVAPDEIVTLIKYYIFDNSSRSIRLADLSKYIGLSKDHLNRLFKQKENISIGQFITKIKMEKASRMLAATYADIKTVAMESGFYEINYFCTVFKKHFGKTPSEFRHENQAH
ncbi:MAG: AraC family transcriptional regulator [Victivallales bacterium]|nr:AraC family transcriptional regulator [Victivallales bacterium]